MNNKFTGIYLDSKTNTYYVSTRAKTLDGVYVSVMKRGFNSRTLALKYKNEKTLELNNSYHYVIENGKTSFELTVAKYIEYLKSKGLLITTLHHLENTLNKHIVPIFRNIEIKKLGFNEAEELMKYLANNNELSNKSKNDLLQKFIAFLNYCQTFNLIKYENLNNIKSVLNKFKVLGSSTACQGIITPDAFNELIATYDDATEMKYKMAVSTIFATGCRSGEIRALLVSDLDVVNCSITFSARIVTAGTGSFERLDGLKAAASRTETLPTKLLSELIEYINSNDLNSTDYLFYGSNGKDKPISANALRHNIDKHLELAGLEHVRIHDFRHSQVVNLLDYGVDIKTVSERVGHKDVSITQNVYNHSTEKRNEKCNNAINDIFN